MAPSAEIKEVFLRKGRNGIVGTNHPGTGPNMTPYWYLYDPDADKFLISTLAWVAKVKDIRRDPNMSLLVDDPTSNLGLYVLVYGKGRIIDPGEECTEKSIQLIKKYRYSDEASWQHWKEINADNDRVIIEMTPTKWVWRDV